MQELITNPYILASLVYLLALLGVGYYKSPDGKVVYGKWEHGHFSEKRKM